MQGWGYLLHLPRMNVLCLSSVFKRQLKEYLCGPRRCAILRSVQQRSITETGRRWYYTTRFPPWTYQWAEKAGTFIPIQ